MNTIYDIENVLGVWLIAVRTPDGARILVNHKGAKREALRKANLAVVP